MFETLFDIATTSYSSSILFVGVAFKQGQYRYPNEGINFGSGSYGDLAAMCSAILLDPEHRSAVLDHDPFYGSLREPIVKVIAFMRAMEFDSTAPLIELDLMNEKVGQAPYEQPSVFSFFKPEYKPPGPAAKALVVAPEAEVMSSSKVCLNVRVWYMLFTPFRSF